MEKKFLIPTIIGVLLLVGIVFTVVYKTTNKEPINPEPVETVAPKETEPIEEKVITESQDGTLSEFEVNIKGTREAGEGKDISELLAENTVEDTEQNNNILNENGDNTQSSIEESPQEVETSESISSAELAVYIMDSDDFTQAPTEAETMNMEEMATDPAVLERLKELEKENQ